MKIPQVQTPTLNVNQTSGSPPFSMPVSSPRMNIHMNDAILDTIGNSISSINHQVVRYNEEIQKAQDDSDFKDATNRAQLAIGNYMNGLENNSDYSSYGPGLEKLKESLNKDENFKKLRPQVAESVRMNYNDMFTEAQIRVNGAANKEQIGQMKTKAKSRYNQAIESGDYAAAETEIKDGVKFGYIQSAEGMEKINDIAPKMAFYQVRREIDGGDPASMSEMLSKRDDKGVYVHFKDLRQQDREHLISSAGKKFEYARREFQTNLEIRQNNGTLTPAEVDNAINTRKLDPNVGMRIKKELEDPNKDVPFKPEIMKTLLKAEADYIASPQTQEDQDAYVKTFNDNYTLLPKENRGHFRNVMEGFNKTDAKFKQSTSYKVVAKIVEDAYQANELYNEKPGIIWGKGDAGVATQLVNQARIMEEVDTIYKNNPELRHNPVEAKKIGETLVKNIQTGKVVEGYAKNYNLRNDRFGMMTRQEPSMPGWKYLGGDPNNAKSWEKE